MTSPVMPSSSVTVLDVYTKQVEMNAQLGSLNEQLKVTLPDHENRIRALEKWRYGLPLSGLLALGSIALSVYDATHH